MTDEQIYDHFTKLDEDIKRGLKAEQIDSLPEFQYVKHNDDDGVCNVCKEEFELGCLVTSLPCLHRYHKECIVQWLDYRKSCPLCFMEVMID